MHAEGLEAWINDTPKHKKNKDCNYVYFSSRFKPWELNSLIDLEAEQELNTEAKPRQ